MKTILSLLLVVCFAGLASGAEHQSLAGSQIPDKYLRKQIGRLDGDLSLHLAVQIPVAHQAERDKFLKDVYDPKSPDYHRYLTPAEYTKRFGPSEDEYNKAAAFFRGNGFRVTTSAGRTLLSIDGAVRHVEATFHIHLYRYRDVENNREFYASPDTPWIALNVPISGVAGLDSFRRLHPAGNGSSRR